MRMKGRRRSGTYRPKLRAILQALAWIFLVGGTAAIVAAQGIHISGAISGHVEDASGAAVSAATITVTSTETGAERVVTTDDSGNFTAVGLPLGSQEVKAEKKGFKAAVRKGIDLEVGQEVDLTLRLELGEIVEQVVVSEEAPVVNTTTAAISGVVGEREVKDLPLNGRSFDDLITLNPGAINYSALKSAETSTSNGNTFSVSGRRTYENLFLLNGIEYTGSSQLAVTPGGVSGYLLGIDAVREFNVLTDTYSAEYGKRAGAQVSVVTQSGSNALHGSAFEFLRNNILDATNYFAQGNSPPFRQNQFGGSLGGPLKKDKWFLFGNYEGFRQALTQSNVAVVPDAAGAPGILAEFRHRCIRQGPQSEYVDVAVHVLLAPAEWPRVARSRKHDSFRHGLLVQQPQTKHSRRFWHPAHGLRPEQSGFAVRRLYDRRRGQPRAAGRPFVRVLLVASHAGVQSAGDSHFFSEHSEHVSRRLFARGIRSGLLSFILVFAEPRLRYRRRSRRNRDWRRSFDHRTRRAHFRGSEQCGGSCESP
jgi:hypothetical protein